MQNLLLLHSFTRQNNHILQSMVTFRRSAGLSDTVRKKAWLKPNPLVEASQYEERVGGMDGASKTLIQLLSDFACILLFSLRL